MTERIKVFSGIVHKNGRPGLDSDMVVALCRMGQNETAAKLIDEVWAFAPVYAAEYHCGRVRGPP